MINYKLTYFDGRGPAEIIRQLFVVAGEDFEDVRVTFDDWPKLKEGMPFGQLPVLEIDGKQLCQSFAIVRYLAKQFGYAGKNAWEEASVDAIGDQFKDFFYNEIRPYIRTLLGFEKGDLAALEKSIVPAHGELFTFMTNFLKNNPSGYLVGDSLTWADLYLAETATWNKKFPNLYDGFPEVKAHVEKIRSIPELKKYIENRPDTIF
uniref:glutathione transferase n=1 Tax=Haemonchus contortus TaxID=6289 RepID=A0A7I4Y7P4_HAECO|nr:Glutathione S-transferase domain containing protein [Haemonchus contortus]